MQTIAEVQTKSTPPSAITKSGKFVAAKDVAALVSMSSLLDALGIQVNTHSRRAPCLLHGGTNPSAFSWTDDGRWFCFHCARGGDKLSLIQAVRQCFFLDALRFLAALAGVEWAPLNTAEVRRQLAEAKKKAQCVKAATEKLRVLEQVLLLAAREELLSLHKLRRDAGARLAALRRGARPRFAGEETVAWDALGLVAKQELAVSAKYSLLAFGAPTVRSRYALHPEQRTALVEGILGTGIVVDGKGRVMEVAAP